MQQGMQQGRLEEKQETVRNMMNKGYADHDIIELTGLDQETLRMLKNR